ncbi:MAG: NUDIX domain-containing protein [Phycisphaerae bacterium]|nr:NUDIX domain-containing protein [Phycisphaerae bacterium]
MDERGRDLIRGVVAVVCKDGRILSIRRPDAIELGGRWCFPGGAVEQGESQAEALVREVREEVGLDVEAVEKLWEWSPPEGGLILYWWSTRLIDPDQPLQLNPREAAEAIWATPHELRALDGILTNDIEFLDHVEATAPHIDSVNPSSSTITRRTFVAAGAATAASAVLGRRAIAGAAPGADDAPIPRRPNTMPIESTIGVIQTRPASLKLDDWQKEDAKRYADHGKRLAMLDPAFDRAFFEHVETRYIDYVRGLLDQAGRRKIDLVLLPEAMLVVSRNLSRRHRDKFIELCRWSNKAWFDAIQPIAKKYGMIIASCLYQVDDAGNITNDGVLTDGSGSLGVYHKVHLPGWHDQDGTEVTNFVPGDAYPVFETRIGKVGFLICYDIDFPEAATCLALNGAEAILHPTVGYNFPDEEEQVAEARLRTRATDNHCVVACAMPGAGPVRENGCSAIVDHRGTVVAAAGKSREAIIQARVTLGGPRMRYWGELASNARDTFPRKRRPDTYGVIVEKQPPAFPKGKHKWGRYYLYEPDVGLP